MRIPITFLLASVSVAPVPMRACLAAQPSAKRRTDGRWREREDAVDAVGIQLLPAAAA